MLWVWLSHQGARRGCWQTPRANGLDIFLNQGLKSADNNLNQLLISYLLGASKWV